MLADEASSMNVTQLTWLKQVGRASKTSQSDESQTFKSAMCASLNVLQGYAAGSELKVHPKRPTDAQLT